MHVVRGRSSVGRALEWHSRGHGFDSHRLHMKSLETQCFRAFFIFKEKAEESWKSGKDGTKDVYR